MLDRLRDYLLWLWFTLRRQEATALHLTIALRRPYAWPGSKWTGQLTRRHYMAKIGDTFIATIAPTTAGGLPAPVTGVVWTVTASYTILSVSEDTLSAVVQAKVAGTGDKVSVKANAKSGAELTAEAVLPDVDAADEEAVALNLKVA